MRAEFVASLPLEDVEPRKYFFISKCEVVISPAVSLGPVCCFFFVFFFSWLHLFAFEDGRSWDTQKQNIGGGRHSGWDVKTPPGTARNTSSLEGRRARAELRASNRRRRGERTEPHLWIEPKDNESIALKQREPPCQNQIKGVCLACNISKNIFISRMPWRLAGSPPPVFRNTGLGPWQREKGNFVL